MKEGLSKFLLKKRIFSVIMVVSIILGMLPTTASAVVGAGLEIITHSDSDNKVKTALDQGEVWVDKKVEYDTDSDDGTFNVTLKAAGRDYPITIPDQDDNVDVVLVLDTSHSMRDNPPRLADMKAAAVAAVNALLLPTGLDNRVAVVTFNNQVNLVSDFTKDAGALATAINALTTDSGTNTQHAFLVAQQTIKGRAEDDNYRKPVIILMSDGKPSYYHTDLEEHTFGDSGNIKGNGKDEFTNGGYVWWTVKQAMAAKNDITDLRIYTIGFGVGVDNNLAEATLKPTATNTEDYRGTDLFNHKYWEDESIIDPTDDNYPAILQAITKIVGGLTSQMPVSENEESLGTYNIVITDVIGEQFELVGSKIDLPDDVEFDEESNTITWTLTWTRDAEDPDTIAADNTVSNNGALTDAFIHQVSFKVQIKDTAGVGTHNTNTSAKAKFIIPESNTFYTEFGEFEIPLENNGSLTLGALDNPEVTITINKVANKWLPEGVSETFNFNIYLDEDLETKLNEGNVSIPITDEVTNGEVDVKVTVPWRAFDAKSKKATLYVEEVEGESDYWRYDDRIQEVDVTVDDLTGELTFTNTYTPPGTISVTKIWSTGNNTDWPDDVDSVIVELIEAAPDNTSTTPDSITINTTLDAITLTKANPTGFFEDFVKKDDCRYFLNEVKVNGYSTEMFGDIDGEEVIFNNDNSAAITIVNTGDAPEISITKEVVGGSTKTLSGGETTFSYKLVVKNEGTTTLYNVSVEDVMSGPSGATLEYSQNASTDFVIGDMQPQDSIPITYSVTVDKAGTYKNTATVIGDYIDNQCYAVTAVEINDEISEYQLPFVTDSDSAEVVAKSPSSGGGGGSSTPRGNVIVRFVDVDGNPLSANSTLTGRVGKTYETTAKDIEGYTLTAVPDNAEGMFTKATITVEYIYDAEREPDIVIEDEEVPVALPEEEEVPQDGEILPQTGLPIVTVPELFGGALIALGLFFGIKGKKEDDK